MGGLDLGPVRVGDERLAGGQHAPRDAFAAAQHDPGPGRVDVVPGRGDAAARPVGQVDAGQRAAHGEVRLARERLEHLDELERRAQGDGGTAQRGVALGAGRAALFGLEQGQHGGGLVGECLGERDRLGVEVAPLVADEDRDVADLAAPVQGDVGQRGDVEALDEVLADVPGPAGVGHDQRLARGDDACDAGGALVEHLHVAHQPRALVGGDRGVAHFTALRDLGEVDLGEPEAVAQPDDERVGDLRGRARMPHGPRQAVHGFQRRSDGGRRHGEALRAHRRSARRA